jgi:hypothetical protein
MQEEEHNVRVMRDWRGHQKVARMKSMGHNNMVAITFSNHAMVAITFSNHTDVKRKMLDGVPESMLPIWVRQLTEDASHPKRRLTGVVIENAIFTGAIYFVIRHAVDDLVKIGVYNIPHASPNVAAHLFQRGKCVTIVEPYLKIGMDGLVFVRIDNPATDVLTGSQCLPGKDATAWQLEGKQLFAADRAAAAFECWTRALSFAAATSPVSTLLTNWAAALLRNEQPALAVRDCFAALTIDPLQVKAAGRLVDGLSALGLKDVARIYAHGFVERWPELKSHIQTRLRGTRPSEWSRVVTETLWWEEEVFSTVLFIRPESKDECTDANCDQLKASGNDLFRPAPSMPPPKSTRLLSPVSRVSMSLSSFFVTVPRQL